MTNRFETSTRKRNILNPPQNHPLPVRFFHQMSQRNNGEQKKLKQQKTRAPPPENRVGLKKKKKKEKKNSPWKQTNCTGFIGSRKRSWITPGSQSCEVERCHLPGDSYDGSRALSPTENCLIAIWEAVWRIAEAAMNNSDWCPWHLLLCINFTGLDNSQTSRHLRKFSDMSNR